MALNRDLSVLLVQAHAGLVGRELDVADVLAGTGARSVRIAHEVDAPLVVHANDAQDEAVAALRKAAAANHVDAARLAVTQGDAHVLLARRRFDIVDLDPCGSPMPFVDAAMRATRSGGLVCATATDTGALAGTFPRACQRRYAAHHGLHAAPWRAEVGLRILASALVRAAARFDRAATPVLMVAHGHWMRVVVRVGEGKKAGDAAVDALRYATLDDDGRAAWTDTPPAPPHAWAGPLWSGPLHDGALVGALQAAAVGKTLAHPRPVERLLATLAGEAAAPPFWLVSHEFESQWGAPPRRDELMRRLAAAGFAAARTHIDPQGIRTDAPTAQLRRLWD